MLQQLLSAALGVALLGSTAGAATAKASGSGGALCQSKSLTTPYARRGKAPGFEALTLCSNYQSNTCCDRSQTDAVRAGLYHLTRVAAGSDACVAAWLSAQCSVCHPQTGVGEGVPVCMNHCEALHAACKDAYFTLDAATQVLTPCRERDVVCTRLGDWSLSAAQTCELAGFTAVEPDDASWCFNGREPLAPKSRPSPASRKSSSAKKAKSSGQLWPDVTGRNSWLAATASMLLYAVIMRLRRALLLARAQMRPSLRDSALQAAERRLGNGQAR